MATKNSGAATYVSDDYVISTSPKGKKNTIEGVMMSDTPNAGRGKQGGPTAKQADQNKAMMSPTERSVREEQDFKKWSEPNEDQKYAKGGSVSSASKRADGCATKGKTRGKVL
jgi:hypothetical protein